MSLIDRARAHLADAPTEAFTDIAGLAGICLLIFGGLSLPAFF
ncbi:MAG: hypothetical protein AAF074_04740 [Pseudomonadota bacterium]